MPLKPSLLALSMALALAACSKPAEVQVPALAPAQPASAPPSQPAVSLTPAADGPISWIGRWTGPEGTFLEITETSGSYRVIVQNLDGPRSFDGRAESGRLSFVRDGVTETIKPGNGADTGMKWLADKQDCLVVKLGEGYCRG